MLHSSIATAIIFLVLNINGQNYPDFSGKWTLMAEKSEPKGQGAFGETFTAAQDTLTLSIARQVVRQGRGAGGKKVEVELTVRSTYRFDGTETNPDTIFMYPSRSASQIFDTALWSDGKLTILRTERGPVGPPHVVKKQVMWLMADGTLSVETVSMSGGNPSTTLRNYYKKASLTAVQ